MATRAEWKARAQSLATELATLTVERDNLKIVLADCDVGRQELELSLDSADDHIAELQDEYDALKAKYDSIVAAIAKAMQEQNPPPPPPTTPRWYAPTSPFNQKVTSMAVHPNSQAIVNQILDGLPGVVDERGEASRPTANIIRFQAGNVWTQYDYEHPVFFASATDPLHKIVGGACNGKQIRVPANARPAGPGTDGHLVVVQADGTTYEFWQATITPTEIRCSWGDGGTPESRISDGSGFGNGCSCCAGHFGLGAGMIRPNEMVEGINHAIFLVTYNYRSVQWPTLFTNQGTQRRISNNPAVPNLGQRLRLELTDPEIAALPAHLRVLARACRDYGLIVGDTGGGGLHCDNASRQAWIDAGRASGAPESNGTFSWDLRPHVDMRSKLKVLA